MNYQRVTYSQRISDNDASRRDIPSFIEPAPPLISNPFMRPKPVKGTNLLELFEEDSEECDEPELVQVYLRLKPCAVKSNLYEVRSSKCLVTSTDTATAGHGRRTQHNVSKMYSFTHIFGPDTTQKEIFESVVKDNLKKLTEGQSYTLLTYGASGSGKTHTLMGSVAAPGLVPRSLEYLFKIVEAAQQPTYKPNENGAEKLSYTDMEYELQWVKKLRHVSAPLRDKYRRMSAQLRNDITTSSLDLSNRTRYYVWVSFIEIYNEAIYDLLVTSERRSTSKLKIREDSSGHVYIKGATQAFVRSGEEAYDVMVAGKHNLQVAATGVHQHSSRSHCIFTITLLTETECGEVRTSCVRLCDLAGSERAARTKNTGARMAESRAINSSLHVLERCLHMLRRKQKARADSNLVPYRESKLTRVLGGGLSGTRREAVSMVVTVNPHPSDIHETRHVLQLAAVARDIQINSTVAETSLETSLPETTMDCSAEVTRLRADNERLHFELAQAQAQNKHLISMSEENQAKAASTMKELVEEAKDIAKQFYEAQIQAMQSRHRNEIEDLTEEYENKLRSITPSKMAATPSKSQHTIAQLTLEIALLQEKLNAEKLAREILEEEVQHLRKCIDEREDAEKATDDVIISANRDDVVLDHDTSAHDEMNESLEPSFRLETDANMSQNSLNMSQGSDSDDKNRTLSSVLEKTKEDNNSSVYNDTISKMYDGDNTLENTANADSAIEHSSRDTVKTDSYNTAKSDATDTVDEITNVSEIRKSDGCLIYKDKANNLDLKRGTYVVPEDKVDEVNDDSLITNGVVNDSMEGKNNEGDAKVKKDSFKHSTNTSAVDHSLAMFEQFEKAIQNSIDNTEGIKQNIVTSKELKNKRNYFCSEGKPGVIYENDDDSELVTKNVNTDENIQTNIKTEEITVTSLLKTKQDIGHEVSNKANESENNTRSYFDNDSIDHSKLPNIKTNFYFGTEQVEKTAPPVKSKTCLDLLSKKPLEQEKVNKSVNNCAATIETKHVSENTGSIFDQTREKPKRKYFDNIGDNTTSNAKQIDSIKAVTEADTRSPSIVKEDMPKDYDPTTIKKLLGDSLKVNNDVIMDNDKSITKSVHLENETNVLAKGIITKMPDEVVKSMEDLAIVTKPSSETIDKPNLIQQEFVKPLESKEKVVEVSKLSEISVNTSENVVEDFENLYKHASEPTSLDFDNLLGKESTADYDDNFKKNEEILSKYNLRKTLKHNESNEEPNKAKDDERNLKYNLRHKTSEEDKNDQEEQSKTHTKRSLRLRRRKNQSDDLDSETETKEAKLKDIANLQKQFSDVTLDIPVMKQEVKDIPSPEKKDGEENMPPELGAASCPSKSVTRSRRKLFTPRAEPLEESLNQTGDSNEKIYVPRPSYHRVRARRKLCN